MSAFVGQLPWLITRSSGIASLGILFLLMLGGIGHITGFTYRFIEPVRAWIIHKWLGIMLAVTIGIHIGVLLIDSYLPFSLADILIPFHKLYANTSMNGSLLATLAIPSAILAIYLSAWIVLTSLTPLRRMRGIWGYSHKLTYLVLLLVVLHVLYAGTEFKSVYAQLALAAVLVPVVALFVTRLFRSAKLHRSE